MLDTFFTNLEQGWGLAIILFFQRLRDSAPVIGYLAYIFHFIGSEAFILPVTFGVYWSVDKHLGRRLLPFLMFTSWINATFKEALKRPRPFNVAPMRVDNWVIERGYGIPSGHTQNATVGGGVLANELRHWWFLALGILYATLTGLSRMILGAHYPQDIVAGLLIGLTMLAIYGALEPHIGGWLGKQSMRVQLLVVVIGTAVLMAIHPGLIKPTSPIWLTDIIEPNDLLARAMVPVGGFLGIALGIVLEERYIHFDASGSWSQRLFRFIIGMLGVALLYYALTPLSTVPRVPILGDLVHYGVIGFWITFGAPWLFVRLNLAIRTLTPDPYAEK